MKKDDYVMVVAVSGEITHRYGYVEKIMDGGLTLVISMFDEGESKIGFDTAYNALRGESPIDYVTTLTDLEKSIIPLLAAGHDTNKIASDMSIAPTTVRSHLQMLRIKLHLDTRAQLIALSPALDSRIKKQAKVDKAIKEINRK